MLVVVDRPMKYVHFWALKHPYSAKDVVVLFAFEVNKLHRYPSTIVSDRDKIFMSSFQTELFKWTERNGTLVQIIIRNRLAKRRS